LSLRIFISVYSALDIILHSMEGLFLQFMTVYVGSM
jgi:hypothetical protein